MSRLARTPANFPRMKVRGRRNRARSAERHSQRFVLRMTPVQMPDGSVQFTADPNGSHIIDAATPILDGWGRVVAAPPKPQPLAPPKPKSSAWHFSMSTEFSDVDPHLVDLITGRAS